MPDILHRVGVVAAPDAVYTALTTIDGLTGWWTDDATGDASAGGVIRFSSIPGGLDLKVLDTRPGELVRWEVVQGPKEWIGTHIVFGLSTSGDYTIVLFKHEGWREAAEFMHHCSTKWAIYMISLKKLVETGKGDPAPHDYTISDWN
ncbi:SRPBCC family protein [Yinghuangia soli]|uniref:SRPBCC domain-containing protein n=1 Tax=Yinghuangia soli TaxID=2908204 RepID=A0AA41Q5Z6_9ACTN|nr:SRPBCC domain-containing protein [Yinghuangia soli]MCF2530787.1 SRPBCC domain-containing protein [Yinghuangia soli]